MPLYEYRCAKCGEQIEVLQKFSDPPLRKCKDCRGKLEKLISRTSFHLKGGGWFDEGYGGKPSKESSDSSTSPKTGKSADSKDASSKKKTKKDSGSKSAGSTG